MPNDPHRPLYHFSPDHWMNDPIPFFWNGEHHIFFQYNPNGAFWGTMHWGHAVSRDLVHWQELPVALTPDPDGPDRDGCFTGCVVEESGRVHLLYTGIPRLTPLHQVQCLASSDDLITWEEHPGNPIIAAPPPGFGECFRDPCAWKEGDEWRLIIGSEQLEGSGGAALLYRSRDLTSWEYLHPLFLGTAETGHDVECPDFFLMDDRQVLLTSRGQTYWHLGRYAGDRFTRERWGIVDGGALYAAKTLLDDQGRRLLWGWIREERPEAEQRAAGWSGVLSLPRVLTLRPDGSLGIEPAPELEALRGRHWHFEDLQLSGDGEITWLDSVEGDALELLIRFAPPEANRLGVLVRASPDGKEGLPITYDRQTQRLGNAPLALGQNEELVLRIFVDRSVVEAFANGRACHATRFYPQRGDCRGVGLCANGGRAHALAVDIWELGATNERPEPR